MREIYLINSSIKAVVDDEDYADLICYSWRLEHDGYVKRFRPGGHILMHRQILNLIGENHLKTERVVDHINELKHDNRRSNLRIVTQSENLQRRGKKSGVFTSKYKGVYFYKPMRKWKAEFTLNRKRRTIGYFNFSWEAAIAYDNYVKVISPLTRLNFVIT